MLFCIATISLITAVGLTIAISFSDDIVEKGFCACYAILGWIWMLVITIAI
jgi:hypothetical protein